MTSKERGRKFSYADLSALSWQKWFRYFNSESNRKFLHGLTLDPRGHKPFFDPIANHILELLAGHKELGMTRLTVSSKPFERPDLFCDSGETDVVSQRSAGGWFTLSTGAFPPPDGRSWAIACSLA